MALTLTNRGAGWTSQFLASTTATSPLFGDMWTRGLDLNLLNPNDYLLLGKVCSERVVQAGNLEKARSPKLLLMGELFHINEPISAAEIAAIAGKFRTLVQTMQAGQGVPAAERVAENASLAVCKTAFLVAAEEVHTRTLGSLSAFVTSLVAYTKKGNISDNLVTRLTDNIKDSTQKTVVIDAELVRVFYNQYARGLNETTAIYCHPTNTSDQLSGDCESGYTDEPYWYDSGTDRPRSYARTPELPMEELSRSLPFGDSDC